jgi:prolyl oligopeptidase
MSAEASASASASATTPSSTSVEDPYIWLEEVESEQALDFAKEANAKCLAELGDPATSSTGTYQKVLNVLESDERIAYVSKYGVDDEGESIMFNLWKDSKNTKGLWRKTTMTSYKSDKPEWTTVLDIDELAEKDGISWVWKGSTSLSRKLDPMSDGGKRDTRTLLSLSRGGADAAYTKEFDFIKEEFVTEEEGGFMLPEAKTRASYKSRDVLYVGSDFGEGSLTDSGYPRVIKEWVRGTKIEDAPIVFEGEKTDVAVSASMNDQRLRGGPIYEKRSRSVTFYTTKQWVRRVEFEHLLAPDDPARNGIADPEEFIEVDVQADAGVTFVGKWMMISLRSDWEPVPGGKMYKSGSLIYTVADTFLTKGKEACDYSVLFEPTERTAYEGYSFTKNYFILSSMDNVKSKLEFYKMEEDGFNYVGGDKEGQIRSCDAGAIDPTENDEIWLYTSGYTEPSALSLGDASKVKANDDTAAEEKESYLVEALKSLPAMYDASDLVVTQKFATSKDGTAIPYFMVSKKDVVLDGTNPTLLYGYGGFEISLGPKYIATVGVSWLERGGVYVEANIRGAGEFGPTWHQAGLKAKRHKCYEDFIAVGEDLVSSKMCTPSTLAARGGSNGGLLMGMMYCMRPDLFGAIHCAVPLLDMKRFHTLLAGASWMAEYGDPDSSDWDEFLHKYSPYHLIDENNPKYSPMLVTTSTRDDRVHPAHARKMVKKLWDLGKDKDWPVYYYENIEGGHGGAADAKQSAFMTALAYDFMWETLCRGKSE